MRLFDLELWGICIRLMDIDVTNKRIMMLVMEEWYEI
jgi:hypothetical protein